MKYPNEKIKIIQGFEDKYIINFLDEIKKREIRSRLNTALSPFIPEELKHMATSIKIESGITIHRAKLVSYIMEQFEHLYDVFMETKDFSRLKKDYESYLVNYANEVVVLHPKESFSGICRGISEKGDLIIEDEKGNIKEVFSGEVSVRGIYGYV